MNRLTVGNVYRADWAFTGENNKGKYEMLKVVNEKGKEEIMIFVNNVPANIAKGDRFCLNEITDVIHKWRKGMVWNPQTRKREEGWVEEFDINAKVTRVDSDLTGASGDIDDFGFGAAPWDDLPADDQLPL